MLKNILLKIAFSSFLLTSPTLCLAETVFVKYRGEVDISNFSCEDTASSIVNRICYDEKNSYLVVLLKNTYYHYCRLPKSTYENWLNADSKGKFYHSMIRGKYDCRLGGVPD